MADVGTINPGVITVVMKIKGATWVARTETNTITGAMNIAGSVRIHKDIVVNIEGAVRIGATTPEKLLKKWENSADKEPEDWVESDKESESWSSTSTEPTECQYPLEDSN